MSGSRSFGAALAPPPATPTPADQNLIGWSFDPALALSNTGTASGVLSLVAIPVREARTVANLLLGVATAGVGLTGAQNWAGLYSPTGALAGQTADQTTPWASTGMKTTPLAAPAAVTPGWWWVGILTNAATSSPAFARAGAGAVAGISSVGLAATASRFGSYSTGLAALPGQLTLGSITTATNGTFWAGLS